MRSPADMDILQVDISNQCHLRCSNCTRLIAHQPAKWEMPVEKFKAAVESLQDWYESGKVAGIIAGEPTLHSDFERIARTFADNFGGPRTTHGREPIADFNRFATERLFDRSNGRGLWTSLGAGFYRHYEVIQDCFSHWNTNTHESGGRHQALLISRKDYCRETGISDDQWLENTRNCWVQNQWSASINDKGAYPCEVMAAIDRLYFDGKHAWPVESGWWKRKPEDFGDMLELCNYCGLAQPGPSQVDAADRDIISPENVAMLQKVGSPAVRKERFDLYQIENFIEKRVVETKDNYTNGDRVGPAGFDSVKPRKVTAVVTCVGRSEHLAKTLAHNAAQVTELIVVTTPYDTATIELCARHHVPFVASERCHDDDHAFNKGRLINDGLKTIRNPDWILFTDADVLLNARFAEFLKTHALNPGVLYGTSRHDVCNADEEIGFQQHALYSNEPNGYFQLWNRRALAIRDRWPAVMSEAFCSAGGVDSWFLQRWPFDKMVQIPELAVRHLIHGELGAGWNGAPRRGWRQCGMLSPFGQTVCGEKVPPGRNRFLLTDTLHGRSVELEIDKGAKIGGDILHFRAGRTIFMGEDIGVRHVHMAVWCE
jgi:hypothetical protein